MPMKKLDVEAIGQAKKNPLFDGLPDKLKKVSAYDRIEKELFDLVQTDHKHKTVKSYVSCAWCNEKRKMRTNKILSYGFKSIEQYHEWRKVMGIIKSKANFQV